MPVTGGVALGVGVSDGVGVIGVTEGVKVYVGKGVRVGIGVAVKRGVMLTMGAKVSVAIAAASGVELLVQAANPSSAMVSKQMVFFNTVYLKPIVPYRCQISRITLET